MLPLGLGQSQPQGHGLHNFGRGPLDDATCQISKLYAIWFQRRRFFNFSYISQYKTQVTPGEGPILTPGS